MSRLLKLGASLILTAAITTPVDAKDLCKSGHLVSLKAESTQTLRFDETDLVQLTTSANCNPYETCRYTFITFSEKGEFELFEEDVTIDDICRTTRRRTRGRPNSYSSGSDDNPLQYYDRERTISYKIADQELGILLLITNYYLPEKNPVWGMWHGDNSGGRFLQLGAETVEIMTGRY